MKTYFAKHIPVEGEINIGDRFFERNGVLHPFPLIGEEEHATHELEFSKAAGDKLAKLFLCSRDIQVGDKAFWHGHLKWYSEDALAELLSIDRTRLQTLGKNKLWEQEQTRDELIKVIGEISPEAIWVKEGDEFVAEGDGIEVFPIHTHDKVTEEIIYVDEYGDKVDIPIYKVKGPCGHFH